MFNRCPELSYILTPLPVKQDSFPSKTVSITFVPSEQFFKEQMKKKKKLGKKKKYGYNQ